jgi:hypothetical protein
MDSRKVPKKQITGMIYCKDTGDDFRYLGWSFLTKDQLRIVTGPVSMPFMGRLVTLCAYCDQKTVMALGRLTSPKMIGGFTQREP